MKIITINFPERYLEAMEVLTMAGIYPSRSELVRLALRDFLSDELNRNQELKRDYFSNIVKCANPKRSRATKRKWRGDKK